MKQLTVFRILTFILLPIAAMFGFMDVLFTLSALSNPPLLLISFMLAAFVIYVFLSIRFLNRHIDPNRPAKPNMRDWLRVNAFVSLFLGVMFLINAVSIFGTSDVSLRAYIDQFMETQKNVPAMLNSSFFLTVMRGTAWFMFFVSIILLVHIFINFKLMKQYRYLFSETPPDNFQ